MKTLEIIDYAMPCMMAERSLKKAHDFVLEKKFDEAITAATQAAAESRLLVVALKEMKERENALRKQTASV
jgi:hypothetical protein